MAVRALAAAALVALVCAGAGTPAAREILALQPLVPLSVPRAAHTATLLPDGTVLVVGGCTVDSCKLDQTGASTEIYVPAKQRFFAGPPLRAPRDGHTATLLRNGGVLVAGGWNDQGLTPTTELFDPERRTFRATGSMLEPRGGFTSTALRDGRVLVAGGSQKRRSLASAELYDPATGHFSATGSLHAARAAHTAVLLSDGRVLLAGGQGTDGRVLAARRSTSRTPDDSRARAR